MTTKRTDTRPRLYTRPDSKWWWFSWSTVDDDGNPVRYRLSCQRLNLTPATHTHDQAFEEILRYYGMSDIPEPGTETLGWLQKHLPDRMRRDGIQAKSIKNTGIALSHLTDIKGADTPIATLARVDIDVYKMHLLERGLRHATINLYLKCLTALFQRLLDDGRIHYDPFARFKPLAKQNDRTLAFNEQYIAALIRTIDEDTSAKYRNDPVRYEARKRLVPLYLFLGLRRNEVLLIRRDEVDLERNRILAMNIKDRQRRKRWITIPRSIRDEVQWFLDTFPGDHPFYVCHPDTITHDVKRWVRASGIPEDLHLHSLRHTFTTLALRYESVWRIKDHLGHSSVHTTEGYAHTNVDDGQEIDIGIDLGAHRERQNGKT